MSIVALTSKNGRELRLRELAKAVRLSQFRKQPRGPKKPRPKRQSGAKIKHVATAKLLKKAKDKRTKNQK